MNSPTPMMARPTPGAEQRGADDEGRQVDGEQADDRGEVAADPLDRRGHRIIFRSRRRCGRREDVVEVEDVGGLGT